VQQAEAVVDLDAIAGNVAYLRGLTAAEVMAVVKADGYGHGALPAARAALRGGATWLGVATVAEACELRDAGLTAPMLAWLVAPGTDVRPAVERGVDISVATLAGLDAAVDAARDTALRDTALRDTALRDTDSSARPPKVSTHDARDSGFRPARVHLKVDTGLNRGGASLRHWPELVTAAAKAVADGTVEVVGVWSHLACADEPGHPSVDRQLAAFHDALETVTGAGLHPQVRHLANSAGLLTRPDTHFDLVRPGIACYGLCPVPAWPTELRPAMTLTARVLIAKRVDAGQGVSYGHTYVTDRPTTLAVVPLGYADGIPRAASNAAPVQAGGKRHRIAGRVCMDQFVIDVGDTPVSAGDPVVLFGTGADGGPTADDWAAVLDTINYEVVTRIGPRVPRRYVGHE
jgi:alanine racemase